MITSAKQLNVTLKKIEDLEASIESKPGIKNPALIKAAGLQTKVLISTLKDQVKEYQDLQSKGLAAIKYSTPEDMMLLPIRYRIAKKMTQDEFSKSVHISLRMIARYESEEYRNITGETLKKILHYIPLKFTGHLNEA